MMVTTRNFSLLSSHLGHMSNYVLTRPDKARTIRASSPPSYGYGRPRSRLSYVL